MAGLYIHIPFCRQACYYCDFHFSTNLSYQSRLVSALLRELDNQQAYLGNHTYETIYFGGGTPSLLDRPDLERLLDKIISTYPIAADPEVTLEANPDDLSPEKLNELKSLGINRLSIGIQTFHEDVLKFIHRAHTSNDAILAFKNARKAGFDNISVDLIFAFPDSTLPMLQSDIDMAVSLDPEHISVYHLTVEEKTVFGNWQKKGKIHQLSEDNAAEQFEYLIVALTKADYEQYEISNFCRDKQYSRHNTSYWKNRPYLGIGPGAHSYNGISRHYNVSNNHEYMRALESARLPSIIDSTDRKSLANDYLLSSLRTKWGCDASEMVNSFGMDIFKTREAKINLLFKDGYLILNGDNLILTKKGRMVADTVIGELMFD